MGSEQEVKKEISGPLEHLLTLNLDRSCILESLSQDVKSEIDNSEEVKNIKKVRFAERLTVSEDDCTEQENREPVNKSIQKCMKGILKVKYSNAVYETEVQLDDYSDENDYEDLLIIDEKSDVGIIEEKSGMGIIDEVKSDLGIIDEAKTDLGIIDKAMTDLGIIDKVKTDWDQVNHDSCSLLDSDIICETTALKEGKEILSYNDPNCLSGDNQFYENPETELAQNDAVEELSNFNLSIAETKDFEDADVIKVSRDNIGDSISNDSNSLEEKVNSSEMCKNEKDEEISDKTGESSTINDSKSKIVADSDSLQSKAEKNIKKDSKGIFQKKIERHFKTCMGVSRKLNSDATDNNGIGDEKNLQKGDEILTPDHRLLKSKQTTKMNTILSKDTVTTASATRLKSVVFSAWHQAKDVKTTNIKIEDTGSQTMKKNNNLGNKTSTDAYKSWKQSKEISIRKKKENDALRLLKEQSKQQGRQSEKEENEMAFQSWKKQKDELLMRKRIAVSKEEKQRQLNSTIEQEMKRKDAEMAFLAWKTQKSQANQIKKIKDSKVLVEQKEKEEMKEIRDKEAQEIYHLWLQTKVSAKSFPSWYEVNDRPPWTPPGKNVLESCQCV